MPLHRAPSPRPPTHWQVRPTCGLRHVARQSVDAKREASKTRASEREKKDEAYLERAKANRERALDFRVRARQSKEAFIAERKEKVKSERCATGGTRAAIHILINTYSTRRGRRSMCRGASWASTCASADPRPLPCLLPCLLTICPRRRLTGWASGGGDEGTHPTHEPQERGRELQASLREQKGRARVGGEHVATAGAAVGPAVVCARGVGTSKCTIAYTIAFCTC